MSTDPGQGHGAGQAAEPPESAPAAALPQGGAGMLDEGAPIGFTADVGGEPRSTDDADEVRDSVVEAARKGPVTDAERREHEKDSAQQGEAQQGEAQQGE